MKLEAEQNVQRLRHHPSIVILAGNNEGLAPFFSPSLKDQRAPDLKIKHEIADYQLAESSELDLDYGDEESDFRKTNFPGRYIYERVLPQIVKEHSDFHYHRGSPYSGHGKVTTDQTYGDLHQWNVWHGTQEPWHNWDVLAGRFVSEFGMSVTTQGLGDLVHKLAHSPCRQAYPNIRTVDYWMGGDASERYPQSRCVFYASLNDRNL